MNTNCPCCHVLFDGSVAMKPKTISGVTVLYCLECYNMFFGENEQ